MKISNLKVYKKISNCKLKIGALSLAGFLAIFGLTGCAPAKEEAPIYQQTVSKTYAKGEHIISVSIDNPTKKAKQYSYHPGYKCVGISTSAYGQIGNAFGGAYLLYVNNTDVECNAILGNNGSIVFNDFGTPLDMDYEELADEEEKIFMEGEHLLSIPIDNPKYHSGEYPSFEGYEPIGMAVSTYGKAWGYYGGGCILYTNIEPVKCTITYDAKNEGSYITFGTPVSKTKIKE